ncbi:MAG: hypothetical protein LKF74_07150 [Megasphaera sp.]|nr:hypothetical protein [Megasphaera sp.]MCH4218318.1 hypothetical protein [Megasphaera sp.]
MFKKITLLFMTFIILGCAAVSAMFFDDNPRYIQIGHDDTTESYIDMDSIQSIRYDPPYYIIRGTVITFDFTTNAATGFENNFFYNFKAQTVKAQTISNFLYDDKGKPVSQIVIANPEVNLCDRYSVNGKAADNAFFNCYNMTFYHTFAKNKDTKN